MNNFIKYLSTFVLAVALMGCGNDSSEQSPEQPSQQQPQQQQQQQPDDQLGGQMDQEAPDIDVSDEEAATFADAAMEAQQIQMQAQQKMVGIIEDEGLDVETYQTIAQSTQTGGEAPDSISDDDMQKYEQATKSLEEVQGEIEQEITTVVEDAGMEMSRFEEISKAAQQDPELQKQIQAKLQEKMGQQGGQGGMQQPQQQQQQQQPPGNNQ